MYSFDKMSAFVCGSDIMAKERKMDSGFFSQIFWWGLAFEDDFWCPSRMESDGGGARIEGGVR